MLQPQYNKVVNFTLYHSITTIFNQEQMIIEDKFKTKIENFTLDILLSWGNLELHT